jgi:hypothetical protein
MGFSFKGIAAKLIADWNKAKSEIAKVVADADSATVKLESDAPEIEAVANAAIPGAGTVAATAISVWESIADILDKGDAAAEENLKNAGLDESLIATIKTQSAAIKKAA